MLGSSQGSSYPGHSSRLIGKSSPNRPLSSGNTGASPAWRPSNPPSEGSCRNHAYRSGSAAAATASAAPQRAAARRQPRGSRVQRTAFADTEITLEYACARSARAEVRAARRQWTEQAGQVPPEMPMWTSRDGWVSELSGWLAADDGLDHCQRLHIKPELVLRVAMTLAAHADHGTGRHCAVTNATVARGAGCSERTVTTVRKVLGASGLAVLIQQGHGSPTSARIGWRPSIWHLVSRRQPVDNPARHGGICDLPPSRRDRRLSHLRDQSPNARTRASKIKSHRSAKRSPRRGRCAPRPLAIQRLADELVGNSYGRDPLLRGLHRGHIGAICNALMVSGIDPAVWSATQIRNALNEDMRTRRSSWPDRIERPAAFLASRLRRLPPRPTGAPRGGLDSRKAPAEREGSSQAQAAAHADVQRWYAEVSAVTTAQQRRTVLRAHSEKFEGSRAATDPFAALANAGRRAARLFPDIALVDGMMRWAHQVLGEECDTAGLELGSAPTTLADDFVARLAIGACDCVQCGAPNAVERPELPLKAMSMVCDKCWPEIASELGLASEAERG
ncbi:Helix-turn-helix domain-containing protein [Mycobacterium sp. smrl_JER01]